MSLTVHFDLSGSIVRSGSTYKLKPVLHLFNNDPDEAAKICGTVNADSFDEGDPPEVVVSVVRNGVETFTVVTVASKPETDATEFCIYWLVPLQDGDFYTVLINNGSDVPYEEVVVDTALGPGETFQLNDGDFISIQ